MSAYQYASNRPVTGIDLDGLEYISAQEARIIMRGGQAHINLENFNRFTRNLWQQRDEKGGWPDGYIGFPTQVGELQMVESPKRPDSGPANLDSGYGSVNPADNPTRHNVVRPTAKSTGTTDRRFADRSVSGAARGMTQGAAGLVLAVNALNWALETYGSFQVAEDKGLVYEHISIMEKQVLRDLDIANRFGYIPEQYQNPTDMGSIANVVLSGVNPSENQELYNIGINIVKEISGNYQPKYDIIYPAIQEGQDRTAPKPFIIRRFE